jgi:hypothetical protein
MYDVFPRAKIIFITNNNKYITVYKARRPLKIIRKFINVSNAFSELPRVSAGFCDHQEDHF